MSKEKIDWDAVDAMADAMTDEEAGIKPGERVTPELGRRLYLESAEKARRRPGYAATLRRVHEEQSVARALRLMRERANITQREVARRMDVKAPAVSRLERFGASTIRALTDYARACGYRIRIVAESPTDSLAMA